VVPPWHPISRTESPVQCFRVLHPDVQTESRGGIPARKSISAGTSLAAGFRIRGVGCRVYGVRCRIQDVGVRLWSLAAPDFQDRVPLAHKKKRPPRTLQLK